MKKQFLIIISILAVTCNGMAITPRHFEIHQADSIVYPGDLFTKADAEKILGEHALTRDSSYLIEKDVSTYSTGYIADSTDKKSGKIGAVYFLLAKYLTTSSAKKYYTSVYEANEEHE